MKSFVLLVTLLAAFLGFSQSNSTSESELYNNYREDQFYASVTYNLLSEKPSGVSQTDFSSGFHFGFIRDMPINTKRNVAIGLGFGLSTNSYNQKNILIREIDNDVSFIEIDEDDYNVSKNKFTTYLLEVPLEIRWRTSNAEDHNFWRIYTGFKVGYLLYNSTKFKSDLENQLENHHDKTNILTYSSTAT